MIGFLLSTFSVRVAYMAFRSPFVTTHTRSAQQNTSRKQSRELPTHELFLEFRGAGLKERIPALKVEITHGCTAYGIRNFPLKILH
jgi:hypothetical protein